VDIVTGRIRNLGLDLDGNLLALPATTKPSTHLLRDGNCRDIGSSRRASQRE
jgi:hypothetical protein